MVFYMVYIVVLNCFRSYRVFWGEKPRKNEKIIPKCSFFGKTQTKRSPKKQDQAFGTTYQNNQLSFGPLWPSAAQDPPSVPRTRLELVL